MKLHDFVKIKLNTGEYAWGWVASILGDIVKIELTFPNSGRTGMYQLNKVRVVENIDRYLYA